MKNGSMRTGRFTAMLAAVACSAWGAGVACAQLVLPDPIPAGVHATMGDIDGDGLFDVVVSHRAQNVVKVWQAVDDNNFVLAGSWEVAEAAGVVLADFDGDGELDLAFGSSATVRSRLVTGLATSPSPWTATTPSWWACRRGFWPHSTTASENSLICL